MGPGGVERSYAHACFAGTCFVGNDFITAGIIGSSSYITSEPQCLHHHPMLLCYHPVTPYPITINTQTSPRSFAHDLICSKLLLVGVPCERPSHNLLKEATIARAILREEPHTNVTSSLDFYTEVVNINTSFIIL